MLEAAVLLSGPRRSQNARRLCRFNFRMDRFGRGDTIGGHKPTFRSLSAVDEGLGDLAKPKNALGAVTRLAFPVTNTFVKDASGGALTKAGSRHAYPLCVSGTGSYRQEQEFAMSLLAHAYLCRLTPIFQGKRAGNGIEKRPSAASCA